MIHCIFTENLCLYHTHKTNKLKMLQLVGCEKGKGEQSPDGGFSHGGKRYEEQEEKIKEHK